MKRQNKIEVEQGGWSVQRLTQWPISATYHHCGWCTSTDKDEFEHYTDEGKIWVVFKPKDRPTRPSFQLYLSDSYSTEIMSKGNRSVKLSDLIEIAPERVSKWFADRLAEVEAVEAAHEARRADFALTSSSQLFAASVDSNWVAIPTIDASYPSHRFHVYDSVLDFDSALKLCAEDLKDGTVTFSVELTEFGGESTNATFGSPDEFDARVLKVGLDTEFTIRNMGDEKLTGRFSIVGVDISICADGGTVAKCKIQARKSANDLLQTYPPPNGGFWVKPDYVEK